MKKIFFIALTAVFTVMSASAQESVKTDKPYEFTPSWFVNVQGGIQMPYTPGDRGDLISPAFALNIGRNVNRYASVRLGIEGAYSRFKSETKADTYNRFTYATGSFDAMLNMVSLFSKQDHPLNFFVLGGVGANWSGAETTNSSHFSPNLRLGAQFDWRLSRNFAINLEYRAENTNDQFNSRLETGSHDWYSEILLGVSLVLPDSKAVYKDNTAEIDELNKRINDLRAENERLRNQPAKVETKTVVEKEAVLPNVFFKLAKSKISLTQKANVKAIADYLKANPDMKVTVTGYASPEGKKAYNEKLSQRRADAVAKMLVNDYGISADRITTKAGGPTSAIYPENQLNRVAVSVAK